LEILGIIFAAVFVTPIVVIGFVGFYWSRGRDRERLSGVWQTYARRRGLVFGAPSGDWPNRTPPRIEWIEHGVAYRIEAQGAETTVSTCIVARPAIAVFGELVVTRPNGNVTHRADVDPLDAGLVVKDQPAGFAGRVLTDGVKRALLGFGSMSLEYRRGEVSLGWAGGEENEARLDEAGAVVRRVLTALAAAYEPGEADAALTLAR
jgi:hypothetical protein